MIITKKAIPRRTILRGAGAALALPLLDGMVPALTALTKSAAKPVLRFGAVYVPNGIAMAYWTPKAEGMAWEPMPVLEVFQPFRDQLIVLTGLNSKPPAILPPGGASAVHSRASTRFLTDVPPQAGVRAGISMDQVLAKAVGQETQLPSLELSLDSVDNVATGSCDAGSCVYTGTIAWSDAATPLPMETDPRAVFERLFGDADSTDSAARRRRIAEKRSILDSVTDKLAALRQNLGPGDREKVAQYVDAIRNVENRIENAERESARELPVIPLPASGPSTFEEYTKLMFDLQLIAYQSDITRIATFMIGREYSGRTYPEIGVPDAHHPVSHHRNEPEWIAKNAKINGFHASLFAGYVDKLRKTTDGDGSLLDHMILIYGAGMSDGNIHSPENLPIVVVGGGAGQLKGGGHIRYPRDTPLANLHLTLMDKFGVHIDKIGDSTGRLELLEGI